MVSPPGERTDTVNTSGTFPQSSSRNPSQFSPTRISTGTPPVLPDLWGGVIFPSKWCPALPSLPPQTTTARLRLDATASR